MNKVRGAVYVLGAGGHAKVVISTLQAAGHIVEAVFDDDREKWGRSILGLPVVGPLLKVEPAAPCPAVIAVGDNASRRALTERLQGIEWATVVHPNAWVHPSANIGPGTVVFAGAVIQPDAVVGAHSIINTGATVDHDCIVGDYVHIAPGCNIGGGVFLEEGVLLGIGSAVIPGTRIGHWTTVGAGGVVIHDLPANAVAVGVPAKLIKMK